MARARHSTTEQEATPNADNDTNTRRNVMAGIPLDLTEIGDVLAGTGQRGVYTIQLDELLGTDTPGVKYSLTDGQFKGKKSASVKTGFENAKKKILEKSTDEDLKAKATHVVVRAKDDAVFVIRQDLVAAAQAA